MPIKRIRVLAGRERREVREDLNFSHAPGGSTRLDRLPSINISENKPPRLLQEEELEPVDRPWLRR